MEIKFRKYDILPFNMSVNKCIIGSYGILKIIDFSDNFIHCLDVDNNKIDVSLRNFKEYYRYIDIDYFEITNKVNKILIGELDIKALEHQSDNSNMLVSYNKQLLVGYKDELQLKHDEIDAIHAMLNNLLKNKANKLYKIMQDFKVKIKKMHKIIWTVELYLGVNENIVQIQSGKSSEQKTIYLLQDKLYIDEEVGDPTDNGIDITTIDDFYNWLTDKSSYHKVFNYELLLPFEKSIRIMQLRRNIKKRSTNPWINTLLSTDDKNTYLLIRNGFNLYIISTSMHFGDKLFPGKNELLNLYSNINKDDIWKSDKIQKINDVVDNYKRNFIILQGIFSRTDIFNDVKDVNLLSDTIINSKRISFFYEDIIKLNDGNITPLKWFEKIKNVKEGDYVLYLGTVDSGWYGRNNFLAYRFYNRNFVNEYSYPYLPSEGLYLLYKDKGEYVKDTYYIKTPIKSKYWDNHNNYKVSKKTARFKIEIDEDFVYNFNIISIHNLNEMNKLLHDRRERRFYLTIRKALLAILKYKTEELKYELPFAKLVMSQNNVNLETARDAIYWWKNKNKWKRTLNTDDIKALRMIKKYLNKNANKINI